MDQNKKEISSIKNLEEYDKNKDWPPEASKAKIVRLSTGYGKDLGAAMDMILTEYYRQLTQGNFLEAIATLAFDFHQFHFQ